MRSSLDNYLAGPMVRSFLPVGQGTFAVERFAGSQEDFSVVFDCGSATDLSLVEEQIKDTFQWKEEISAVFITQMSGDHVNGLEYLLKYCQVRKIYFPHRNQDEIRLSKLIRMLEDTIEPGFTEDFLENPLAAVRELSEKEKIKSPTLYSVLPTSEKYLDRDTGRSEFWQIRHVLSGQPLKEVIRDSAAFRWTFIANHFQEKERCGQFLREIGEGGLDLEAIWKQVDRGRLEDMDSLRRIYRRFYGGISVNAMVVYSGKPYHAVGSTQKQVRCDISCLGSAGTCQFYGKTYPSGCLYMGDYNGSGPENWGKLQERLNFYWGKIGVIQVPRHGSGHHFNAGFASRAFTLIISAGSENRYRHPHAGVLKRIILNNVPFFWVSERPDSRAMFRVSI